MIMDDEDNNSYENYSFFAKDSQKYGKALRELFETLKIPYKENQLKSAISLCKDHFEKLYAWHCKIYVNERSIIAKTFKQQSCKTDEVDLLIDDTPIQVKGVIEEVPNITVTSDEALNSISNTIDNNSVLSETNIRGIAKNSRFNSESIKREKNEKIDELTIAIFKLLQTDCNEKKKITASICFNFLFDVLYKKDITEKLDEIEKNKVTNNSYENYSFVVNDSQEYCDALRKLFKALKIECVEDQLQSIAKLCKDDFEKLYMWHCELYIQDIGTLTKRLKEQSELLKKKKTEFISTAQIYEKTYYTLISLSGVIAAIPDPTTTSLDNNSKGETKIRSITVHTQFNSKSINREKDKKIRELTIAVFEVLERESNKEEIKIAFTALNNLFDAFYKKGITEKLEEIEKNKYELEIKMNQFESCIHSIKHLIQLNTNNIESLTTLLPKVKDKNLPKLQASTSRFFPCESVFLNKAEKKKDNSIKAKVKSFFGFKR